MNGKVLSGPVGDVRAVWLFALCVFFGGGVYVVMGYERAIAASYDRTAALYRQTTVATRLIRESAHIRGIERQARTELARISHDSSSSETTAQLLATLQSAARTFATPIVLLHPEPVQASPGPLQATPLTIHISGTFRNILRFVEDLSHHATLMDVSDTEIALTHSAQNNAAQPLLEATIHATLYRLQLPRTKETPIVRSQ
jgi:Tfp pilus assembly protein PilO